MTSNSDQASNQQQNPQSNGQHQQQQQQTNENGSKLTTQQLQITNSLFIRKEIQRFESVHPNIYSIYDLIDSIGDFNLQQQIREHIVNIEDSFVNSQEWTLSRNVPDLKLGIVGSMTSGKSSLVHRFLTGTYMQEESPEGGRFKKEVIIDGQSYLLLIRDEGGPPEMQFTHWCDAVVFVFSLENEESFLMAHQFYTKMANYRNMSDVPFLLVGTLDYVSEASPRSIDDARVKALALELRNCSYYETSAVYGSNVERLFLDACQKVINMRVHLLLSMANITNSTTNNTTNGCFNQRPGTPAQQQQQQSTTTSSIRLLAGSHLNGHSNGSGPSSTAATSTYPTNSFSALVQASTQSLNGVNNFNSSPNCPTNSATSLTYFLANPHLINTASLHASSSAAQFTLSNQASNNLFKEPLSIQSNLTNNPSIQQYPVSLEKKASNFLHPDANSQNIITPCSTPNQKRKDTNRRRSNLFTPNKKEDKQNKLNDVGIGRSIPVKQGFLYKKTNSTINKDWKKKFVTLNDDGSLRYYPSMNDYMDDAHGKEIDLQKTTIKIPGANKPRIGKSFINLEANKLQSEINSLNLNNFATQSTAQIGSTDDIVNVNPTVSTTDNRMEANSKKRHRRIKSNHKSDQNKEEEQEGFEFIIVSLDNKQWHFEAANSEEREEWVHAIEQQILSSLQTNETNKLKTKNGSAVDNTTILAMKNVPGNSLCADCDAPNPVWASLNLGALICIECSGIHRNLGTHLSRVRSLELDDWTTEFVQVMMSIGNKLINSIYEANTKSYSKSKPNPNSSREEKERWIRTKYEMKLFLAPLPNKDIQIGKQLMDAVSRQDVAGVILCLAHSKPDDVNCCVSQLDKRTSLHIASSLSNLVILQLLIWYGADIEARDNQGRTAASYARMFNSTDCAQLLINNGCSESNGVSGHNTIGRKSHSSTSTIPTLNNNNNNNITSGIPFYDKITFNAI